MELIADIKDLRHAIKNIRLAPLHDPANNGGGNGSAGDTPVAPEKLRQLEEQAHEIAMLRKSIAVAEAEQVLDWYWYCDL